MYSVREAKLNDLPVIGELIVALARYEKLEHEVVFNLDELGKHLFGEAKRAEVILAEDHGDTVGFALYFHNFSTFLGRPGIYLEDLFVKPEYRGRGHGLRLLQRLSQTALARGCGRLEWAVLDWNQPAIDFYRSLGARPMSDWTTMRITEEGLQKLAK